MPLECALAYVDAAGIKGSNTKAGRADTSVVVQLEHEVYTPTDPQTGTPTGTRVHRAVTLIKELDAATPLLYKACASGEVLGELRVDWYHITATGQEEVYFTQTMKNVRVMSVELILPNTKEPAEENKTHLERLKLMYGQIQWEYVDGGIMHIDSWMEEI